MLFKTQIKEIMQHKGLKQADLCRKTGISTALMSKYISGKTSPSLDNAEAIANALQVTLDELVGRDDKKDLTEQESNLLTMFRELGEADQQEIFHYTEYKCSQKFLRETSSREADEKFKGA